MKGSADKVEIATYETGPREVIGIGIPSHGMAHLFFAARLINLRMPMNRIVRWFFIIGKEVGAARNEIAAKALAVGDDDPSVKCTKLLFLDDDLLFHPDLLVKLLSHDRPLISGLYYTKTSVPVPLVLHGEFDGVAKSWTPGDVIECEGHGMGLCLIDTEVLQRVRDEGDIGVDAHGYPNWFQTKKDQAMVAPDGTRVLYNGTEDYDFLRKARALGYQPAVDTSAETFAWHLDTRSMSAYPLKQWKEFINTGKVTWATDGGSVTWENVA